MHIATKRNSSKERKSLLIATHDNALRNDYIKAEIDNKQANNKCGLCGNKNETVNKRK